METTFQPEAVSRAMRRSIPRFLLPTSVASAAVVLLVTLTAKDPSGGQAAFVGVISTLIVAGAMASSAESRESA
jgi:hypothetical protein